MKPDIHIVLVEPEIPPNTGNIGRTCIGVGGTLHLVGKLGFSLSDQALKRAGLDYWSKINLRRYEKWDDFWDQLPAQADLNFFSTRGHIHMWQKTYHNPCYLIFGSESRGFPQSFYERFKAQLIRIPINKEIRSLNLSTAVGVATFEVLRQCEYPLGSRG